MSGADVPLFGELGRTIPSRTTDPQTSHDAEKAVRVTANNQRGRLLSAYARYGPMTDDQAQDHADGVNEWSCYWKRCSELRDAGFIADTGHTRTGRAGVQRIVCTITDTGRAALGRIAQGEAAPHPADAAPKCGHEISDGNTADPSYAYCGHPAAHAGPHGAWVR